MNKTHRIARGSITVFGAVLLIIGAYGTFNDAAKIVDTIFGLPIADIYFVLSLSGGVLLSIAFSWFSISLIDYFKERYRAVQKENQRKQSFEGYPINDALQMMIYQSVFGRGFLGPDAVNKSSVCLEVMNKAIRNGEIRISGVSEATYAHVLIPWNTIESIDAKTYPDGSLFHYSIKTKENMLVWQNVMVNMIDMRRLYGVSA